MPPYMALMKQDTAFAEGDIQSPLRIPRHVGAGQAVPARLAPSLSALLRDGNGFEPLSTDPESVTNLFIASTG